MKDKEKQIEEIKRIIDERCEAQLGQVHASSKGGKVTKTVDTSLIAKDIYNAGYQKVDKDSIVLSREEYEKYKIIEYLGKESKSTIIPAHKLFKTFREIEEKSSKETAEKFYKKVRKLLKKVDIIVDGDEGLVGYEESAVDKGLTEIAKQFDVEIKE